MSNIISITSSKRMKECSNCGNMLSPKSCADEDYHYCSYECGKVAQPECVKMVQKGHRQ